MTVYTVVADGLADGLEQLVHESPVPGAHVYVVAPTAVSEPGVPLHMVMLAADTVTGGKRVMRTVSCPVQPFASVPITL